jgi:hypothetical protein
MMCCGRVADLEQVKADLFPGVGAEQYGRGTEEVRVKRCQGVGRDLLKLLGEDQIGEEQPKYLYLTIG